MIRDIITAIQDYNSNWNTGKAVLIPDKLHKKKELQDMTVCTAYERNCYLYVRAESVKKRIIEEYPFMDDEQVITERTKMHGNNKVKCVLYPYAKLWDLQKVREKGLIIANGFVCSDYIC